MAGHSRWRAAFEECLRLQRVSGDQHLVIRAMVGLAQVLVALGRTDEAKPMAQEIIEFAQAHNDKGANTSAGTIWRIVN